MLDFVRPKLPQFTGDIFNESASNIEQVCVDQFLVDPYLERFVEIQSMKFDLGRLTEEEFETKIKEAKARAKLYYGVMVMRQNLCWSEAIPKIREAGYNIDAARKYFHNPNASNKERKSVFLSQPKCEFQDNEASFAFLAGATLSARPVLKEKRVFPRLSINCKNVDNIDRVKDSIRNLTGLPATQNDKTITTDNLELFWNIHCANGKNGAIPEEIIYDRSEALAFLQGAFSVRGHYDKNQNCFIIGTNWPDTFRADFTRLCERFGIYTSLVNTNRIVISERNSLKNLLQLKIVPASQNIKDYAYGDREPHEIVPIIIFRRYQNLIRENPTLVNNFAELERRLKVSRGVFEDWKHGKYSKVIRSYLKVKSANVSEAIQIRKMRAHLIRVDLPRLQDETGKIANPRYINQVIARLETVQSKSSNKDLGKSAQKSLRKIAELTADPSTPKTVDTNTQNFSERARAVSPTQILLKDLKKEPDSDFFYQNGKFLYFDPYACLDRNGQGNWNNSKIKIQEIPVIMWIEDLFRGMSENDNVTTPPKLPDLSAPAEIRKILIEEFSKNKNVIILDIN